MVIGNIFYKPGIIFKVKRNKPRSGAIRFVAAVVGAVFSIFGFSMAKSWYGVHKVYNVIHVLQGILYKTKIFFIIKYKNKIE